MNKGMLVYLLAFIILITGTLVWSNYDTITPVVAHAQAERSVGVAPVQMIETGASWIFKLLLGGLFAGIAAAVYAEARKIYKAWMRNSQMKRWTPGPNAQWKQTAQVPRLKREDLMLLALMQGRNPNMNARLPKVPTSRTDPDDELDLEF